MAHRTGVTAADFHLLENIAIGVDAKGKIAFVDSNASNALEAAIKHGFEEAEVVALNPTQILMPGLYRHSLPRAAKGEPWYRNGPPSTGMD